MRRRQFITLLGGTVAWPIFAQAQPERVRRIGVLLPFDNENDAQVRLLWPAFTQRLHELGWVEGRNLKFDVHFTTQNIERIRAGATELVASAPELIVVWSNPGLAAIKEATQTIPVVFALVGDPVGSGLVATLARPGGNATGFQNFEPTVGGKWLELLKEIAPGVRRVGLVYNQNIPANVDFLRTAQALSTSMGVTVMATELHNAADIERVLTEFAQEPNGGLVVTPNPLNTSNDEAIIELAARFHLPAIYPFRMAAEKGGLVSYGFDTIEQQRGAALYADRVLKGEKPADLPVQAPTKYQLVVNLKTAKTLGLDISFQLQQRADEVIE
ncbi:MAG TPA: ABC transporter substrate-binding protein [Pseudolabrys sp.]|nr:ABC transporter substrate-binding protein [Pseudolabrys sp.]